MWGWAGGKELRNREIKYDIEWWNRISSIHPGYVMGKTYYSGERVCNSDMAPQKIVKINGEELPKKELFKLMNDAFDGEINVLQVSWNKGIKWLLTQGWPDGAIWWRTDEKGRTFSRTNEGWREILTDSTEIRGENKIY